MRGRWSFAAFVVAGTVEAKSRIEANARLLAFRAAFPIGEDAAESGIKMQAGAAPVRLAPKRIGAGCSPL
jgi:hypothetical protein